MNIAVMGRSRKAEEISIIAVRRRKNQYRSDKKIDNAAMKKLISRR
jgi:hypothetical protein